MIENLSPAGQRALEDFATRQGVSFDAVLALTSALIDGNGVQAQFNHPDLGGLGQWSQGGMIMVGDMFNHGLKHRVNVLCNELAQLLRNQSIFVAAAPSQTQSQTGSGVSWFVSGTGSPGKWWPADLGSPSSAGAQNDLRYACFPAARRLAIQQGASVRVYDTGDHVVSGFSQQQSGDRSLTFTSQFGVVRVDSLPLVSPSAHSQQPPSHSPSEAARPEPAESAPTTPPGFNVTDAASGILATIEQLAGLHQRGILTDEEFKAKKAELLSRL